MYDRYLLARIKAKQKSEVKVKTPIKTVPVDKEETHTTVNPSSKTVYAYVGKKLVGEYDSITLCASTLGMSRAMVKKVIESGVELENGFILKLNK